MKLEDEGKVDLSRVVTFNLDEYWGIPLEHPQSYSRFMRDNFFFPSGTLRVRNTHIPPANSEDPHAAAQQYEQKIRDAGGVDLWLIGVGHNGHIAFNEPGSSFDSRTRLVTLSERTIKANSRFFDGDATRVPREAMTVGISTIMDARHVVLVAYGEEKAPAIKAAVNGPVTPECPASCLQ